MAAAFERKFTQYGAVERQHDDRVLAIRAAASGDQIAYGNTRAGIVVEHAGKCIGSARRREGERRTDQEVSPVNRHRAH